MILEKINICFGVEIKCIPKSNNENCIDIVQQVAKNVNSVITVKSVHRISTIENNISIIISELTSSDMRKNVLKKVKSLKLNANMISNNWSNDSKIYVLT